jgi:hypothetical protein
MDPFEEARDVFRLAGDAPLVIIASGSHPSALSRLRRFCQEVGHFVELHLGDHDPIGPGPPRRLVYGLVDLDPGARAQRLRELNVRRDRIRVERLQVVLFIEGALFQEAASALIDLRAWASAVVRIPPPRVVPVRIVGPPELEAACETARSVVRSTNIELARPLGFELVVASDDTPELTPALAVVLLGRRRPPRARRGHSQRLAASLSLRFAGAFVAVERGAPPAVYHLARLLAQPHEPRALGDESTLRAELSSFLEQKVRGLGGGAPSPPRPRAAVAHANVAAVDVAAPDEDPQAPPPRPFIGRAEALSVLDASLSNPELRVVLVVGEDGLGKTALLAEWSQRASTRDHPRIERRYVRSLEDRSAEVVMAELLRCAGERGAPPEDPIVRGERLVELLRERPTLLVLDGLEDALDVSGRVIDPGLSALLIGLSARGAGLCVLASRTLPSEPWARSWSTARIALVGLEREDAGRMARASGVRGTDDELDAATATLGGHPLAIKLLAGVERKARRWPEIVAPSADPDRVLLDVLRCVSARTTDREALVSQLIAAAREVPREGVLAHRAARRFFADEERKTRAEPWRDASERAFRSRWRAESPAALTRAGALPGVVHQACEAGGVVEVFRALYRSDETTAKPSPGRRMPFDAGDLGWDVELRVLREFFAEPWTRPHDALSQEDRSALYARVLLDLDVLGRLEEAENVSRGLLPSDLARGEWQDWAPVSRHADLLARIGRLPEAARFATEAVELAKTAGWYAPECHSRAARGRVLVMQGRGDEAEEEFKLLHERMREATIPGPLGTYSAWYCELLRDRGSFDAARDMIAWNRSFLEERAAQDSNVRVVLARFDGILADIALAEADLARAEMLLARCLPSLSTCAAREPRVAAFLTRAALARTRGDLANARRDVDLTARLVELCGCHLYRADVALEQVRFSLAVGDRPGALASFHQARALIARTGYHRRDGPLAELAASLRVQGG